MRTSVLGAALTGLALLVSSPAISEKPSEPNHQSVQNDFSGYPNRLVVDGATLTLTEPGKIKVKDRSHPSFYFLDLSGKGTRKDGILRKGHYTGLYSSGTALTLTLMKDIDITNPGGVSTIYIPLKTFNLKKPADYTGDDVNDVKSLIRQARDFKDSKDYEAAVANSKLKYLTIVDGKILNGSQK